MKATEAKSKLRAADTAPSKPLFTAEAVPLSLNRSRALNRLVKGDTITPKIVNVDAEVEEVNVRVEVEQRHIVVEEVKVKKQATVDADGVKKASLMPVQGFRILGVKLPMPPSM